MRSEEHNPDAFRTKSRSEIKTFRIEGPEGPQSRMICGPKTTRINKLNDPKTGNLKKREPLVDYLVRALKIPKEPSA